MNENIDLTEILKDCPNGTVFWSDDYGKVEFLRIDKSCLHPIVVIRTDGNPAYYTKEGWCSISYPASCLLWPSKDCRDWSNFTAPWYKKDKFDPKTLKPFEKVLGGGINSIWKADFFSHEHIPHEGSYKVFPYKCTGNMYEYCIPYNDDTKHLVGTEEEAPEYYRYWED